MIQESSNSSSRRGFAKQNQFLKAFGFQRSEKSFQVCIQVRASRWQANWLHAFASLASTKRLTDGRITIHDQLLLVFEKAVLVVGQFVGNCLYPPFIRFGGPARELDVASFPSHDKEQIKSGQAALGLGFHCDDVDRSHDDVVRL